MRVSFGLGLVAMMSLVACTAPVTKRVPYRDGATTTTDGTDPAAVGPAAKVASGISVSGVAVFQGVKVPVVRDGAEVADEDRTAPVIVGRAGLVRAYVTPGPRWSSRSVTAQLYLFAGGKRFPVIRDTKTISGPSTDDDAATTFDFEVSADQMREGVGYQVVLTTKDGVTVEEGTEVDGRFPRAGGFVDLGAKVSAPVKIMLVPLKYDADDTGRTPSIAAESLARFEKTIMQRYPVTGVDIQTHDVVPWSSEITSDGTGWDKVLSAMQALRAKEKPAKDVYYYALFTPTDSFSSFCKNGCVAGLSPLAQSDSQYGLRVSVGLGFDGQEAANTMAHELGHAHGREHAPCGGVDPKSVDTTFPYDGGKIGVLGYDIIGKTFMSNELTSDMMGYCKNEWVSDYTYNALFARLVAVSGQITTQKDIIPGAEAATPSFDGYRVATVGIDGKVAWSGSAPAGAAGGGQITKAHFLSAGGAELAAKGAHFYPFDHLPGGFLYVPEASSVDWSQVRVEGFTRTLAR